MQMTPHLMVESKEELKSLLKVKEKSEKVGLKLNTQKKTIRKLKYKKSSLS